MKPIFDQQIGIFKNVLPDDWCNDIINIYQTNLHHTIKRGDFEKVNGDEKKDTFLSGLDHVPQNYISFFQDFFIDQLLPLYEKEYPTFSQITGQKLLLDDFKIQKTLPGEGYHLWHFESMNVEKYINRILAWTIYLNDVEEGGETEFLYQHKRIPATKGTVCIFPAYFTHTHRGNPPLSGEKYIITGWVSFLEIFPHSEMLKYLHE